MPGVCIHAMGESSPEIHQFSKSPQPQAPFWVWHLRGLWHRWWWRPAAGPGSFPQGEIKAKVAFQLLRKTYLSYAFFTSHDQHERGFSPLMLGATFFSIAVFKYKSLLLQEQHYMLAMLAVSLRAASLTRVMFGNSILLSISLLKGLTRNFFSKQLNIHCQNWLTNLPCMCCTTNKVSGGGRLHPYPTSYIASQGLRCSAGFSCRAAPIWEALLCNTMTLNFAGAESTF